MPTYEEMIRQELLRRPAVQLSPMAVTPEPPTGITSEQLNYPITSQAEFAQAAAAQQAAQPQVQNAYEGAWQAQQAGQAAQPQVATGESLTEEEALAAGAPLADINRRAQELGVLPSQVARALARKRKMANEADLQLMQDMRMLRPAGNVQGVPMQPGVRHPGEG